jgi:hypothetical protein
MSSNKKSVRDIYYKQSQQQQQQSNGTNSSFSSVSNGPSSNVYLNNSASGKNLNTASTEQLFEDDEVERFDADTYKQKYGDRWKRLASSVRDIVQPDGTVIREYVIEDPGMLEQLSDNEHDDNDDDATTTTSRGDNNTADRPSENDDHEKRSNENNNNGSGGGNKKPATVKSSSGQIYFYDEKTRSFANMNFEQLTEKIQGTSAAIVSPSAVGSGYDYYKTTEKFANYNVSSSEPPPREVKEMTTPQQSNKSANDNGSRPSEANLKKSSSKDGLNEVEKRQQSAHNHHHHHHHHNNNNNNNSNQNHHYHTTNGKSSGGAANGGSNGNGGMNYSTNSQVDFNEYPVYNNNRKGFADRDLEDDDKEVEIIHEQGKLLIYFFSTDFSFQD